MRYYYVAQFTPDEGDTYEVTFPDFPDCITWGEDKDDALESAREALALYLEPDVPYASVDEFPSPTPIEQVQTPNDGFVSYVDADVDLASYSKSVKKTLTIPSWLNDAALAQGINFSQTLQEALVKKLKRLEA
jgi:antitoxin HicB